MIKIKVNVGAHHGTGDPVERETHMLDDEDRALLQYAHGRLPSGHAHSKSEDKRIKATRKLLAKLAGIALLASLMSGCFYIESDGETVGGGIHAVQDIGVRTTCYASYQDDSWVHESCASVEDLDGSYGVRVAEACDRYVGAPGKPCTVHCTADYSDLCVVKPIVFPSEEE